MISLFTHNKKHFFIVFIIFSTIFFGCSTTKVLFTQEFRNQHNLSDSELLNLQYYLKGKILLNRKINSNEKEITSKHSLKKVNDTFIEEIEIKEGTPGVAILVFPYYLSISFEEGSSFYFSCKSGDKYEGDYKLAAKNWKDDIGEIEYENKLFYTSPGDNNASLLIGLESLNNIIKKRKVLEGRKLKN